MRFASFLSGGFVTATVVNPMERKLVKRTSVQWSDFEIVLIKQDLCLYCTDIGNMCPKVWKSIFSLLSYQKNRPKWLKTIDDVNMPCMCASFWLTFIENKSHIFPL